MRYAADGRIILDLSYNEPEPWRPAPFTCIICGEVEKFPLRAANTVNICRECDWRYGPKNRWWLHDLLGWGDFHNYDSVTAVWVLARALVAECEAQGHARA